jgi:hypothetical protein
MCHIAYVRKSLAQASPKELLYAAKLVELDFSHLRVKGIGTLLTPLPQKRKSRCLLPIDYYDATFGPFAPLFSKHLFQHLQVLFSRRLVFAGCLHRPTR